MEGVYPSSSVQPRSDGRMLYSLWSVPYISAEGSPHPSDVPEAELLAAQWVRPEISEEEWIEWLLFQLGK